MYITLMAVAYLIAIFATFKVATKLVHIHALMTIIQTNKGEGPKRVLDESQDQLIYAIYAATIAWTGVAIGLLL